MSKSAQMFGMIERRNGSRLALEAPAELRIGGRLIGNYFDSDIAAEAGIASAIYLAHAAGADEADDLIGAEANAGRESHDMAGSRKIIRDWRHRASPVGGTRSAELRTRTSNPAEPGASPCACW